MINYLLRETKSQERLRLGKLIADKDYAGYIRLFEYYYHRNEYIEAFDFVSAYCDGMWSAGKNILIGKRLQPYIKGVK